MAGALKWSLSPHNQDTTNINCMLLTSRIGHHLGMCPHTWWWQTRNGDHWVRRRAACGLNHTKQATHAYQTQSITSMECTHAEAAHIVTSECVWGGMSWPHGHAGLVGDEGCCCLVVGGGGQDQTIVGWQLALRSCGCRCQGGGGWSGRDGSCARHGGCCCCWGWMGGEGEGEGDGEGGKCTTAMGTKERDEERSRAQKRKRPNNIHIHSPAATASNKVEAPITDQTRHFASICLGRVRTRTYFPLRRGTNSKENASWCWWWWW
jgi:hypothetical protein